MHAANVEKVILPLPGTDEPPAEQTQNPEAIRYDVFKTPRELGLDENAVIHVKELSKTLGQRKKTIKDLLLAQPANAESPEILHLEVHSNLGQEMLLNVRRMDSRDPTGFKIPIRRLGPHTFAKFYTKDDVQDIVVALRRNSTRRINFYTSTLLQRTFPISWPRAELG
ncbi:unnamed protein product [Parascedosporium putredinis]|uniref:Uncharacterized protein n=1 Tax=Parascedosporium putredinis TaxID=1442378 RepID=A0A9P1H2L3_9PEZI|nr:unnamed protein product [Parascedosporium putredinis]CAI7993789.1 unnamed protein product [Parascedosporium putredinis]